MRRIIPIILFLLNVLSISQDVFAVPPLPHTFYGTARRNGVPVPDGTVVSAWINGVQYASNVTPAGGPGTYTFNVLGDDPDTLPIEGGRSGDSIAFLVGTDWASQTYPFTSGQTTQLDLTVLSAPTQYTLSIYINPSGAGSVSKSPNKTTYNSGEMVTLTASPNSGYTFVSWSGDVSGTSLAVAITMSNNKSVTATFAGIAPPVTKFTLTVASNPVNGGSISRTPNQSSFDPGAQVTLNAIANPGYAFAYWSGDASGSQTPITITMDRSKYVLANFVPVLGEIISTPSVPEGPNAGTTGASLSYSTGGASSSEGHPIQYIFDWGDGTDSGWLPVGTSNASHSWNHPNTFLLRARARCATDVSIVSNWTEAVAIVIEQAVLPFIAVLENPVDGQKVTGFTTIDGWALDEKGIKKVELYIDDQFVGNIAYGSTLTDVREAHPEYPNAENSGFCMVLNASSLPAGPHRIKVKLHNLEGQVKDLEVGVNVIKFHGEIVEDMAPAGRLFRSNKVTSNGVVKKYDIKLEWSKDYQGFLITEIIPKK